MSQGNEPVNSTSYVPPAYNVNQQAQSNCAITCQCGKLRYPNVEHKCEAADYTAPVVPVHDEFANSSKPIAPAITVPMSNHGGYNVLVPIPRNDAGRECVYNHTVVDYSSRNKFKKNAIIVLFVLLGIVFITAVIGVALKGTDELKKNYDIYYRNYGGYDSTTTTESALDRIFRTNDYLSGRRNYSDFKWFGDIFATEAALDSPNEDDHLSTRRPLIITKEPRRDITTTTEDTLGSANKNDHSKSQTTTTTRTTTKKIVHKLYKTYRRYLKDGEVQYKYSDDDEDLETEDDTEEDEDIEDDK